MFANPTVARGPVRGLLMLAFAVAFAACVPSGGPNASKADAGSKRPAPAAERSSKPATTSQTRPSSARRTTPNPLLTAPFEDLFERQELGSNWKSVSDAWQISDGKLCGKGARNKGVWLQRRIPTNARIEFDAVTNSPDGDIKAELWGDGQSGATSVSYTNATSYLTIFGGWKNRYHVLARIDEHAPNRLEVLLKPGAASERERPVTPGRTYGFRVERSDGKTISWWVDGTLIHRLEDAEPLQGEGHDHFGFNDWEVPVCFDNLRITPL